MQFLARIEIHNADLQTYYRLHAAMEAESFSRVITDTNDLKQYKMPLGTYWTDVFNDSWAAFNAARRAVAPIDVDQQIQIAVRRCFAASHRAKDPDVAHAEALAESCDRIAVRTHLVQRDGTPRPARC